MKKMLMKMDFKIYYFVNGVQTFAIPSFIRGDVNGIRGDVTGIRGDVTGIRGDVTGISGDVNEIRGDVNGIRGDVNGIRGDVTGIRGDVNDCDILDIEREKGVEIISLVKRKCQK